LQGGRGVDWRYRDRIKDFVLPGDCAGCSLPYKHRNFQDDYWNEPTIFALNNKLQALENKVAEMEGKGK
jgi:hypothetical protein